MKIFFYLRVIVFLCLFTFCKAPTENGVCDPESKASKLSFLWKSLIGDRNSFCGIGFSSSSSSVAVTLTDFKFVDSTNDFNQTYSGTITGTDITINLPYGKSQAAIPTLTTNAASILAGSSSVMNGVTPIDFTSTVSFTITGSAGDKKIYSVTAYLISPVADTNQSNCYAAGVLSTCAATTASDPNQDGHFVDSPNQKAIQTSSTNSGYSSDPINIDKLKGIVWKTCQEGFTGSTCSGGSLSSFDQPTAITTCNNLNSLNSGNGYAGLKKWRLPTFHELNQLQDQDQANILWNTTLFPNAPITTGANLYRWTSSLILPAAVSAMALNELQQTQGTGTLNPVQCVNGDSPPSADLVDNGDGTILNKRTKLVWQKCSMGQTNDSVCSGALTTANWSNALIYCKNLSLAGKTWKLPNITELVSLLDMSQPTPFLNTVYFPNLTVADFHSSTTQMANVAYDNILTINTPIVGGISGKGSSYNVKCVSGP